MMGLRRTLQRIQEKDESDGSYAIGEKCSFSLITSVEHDHFRFQIALNFGPAKISDHRLWSVPLRRLISYLALARRSLLGFRRSLDGVARMGLRMASGIHGMKMSEAK